MLFVVSGCAIEPFTAGVASGATATLALAEKANSETMNAINKLNLTTAEINEVIDAVDGTMVIRPDTIEAIKGLEGREKDPVTWIAIASIIANAVAAGRVSKKGKNEV